MKNKTLFLILILLSISLLLSAQEAVRLYSGFTESTWGRSVTRDETFLVDFSEFSEAMSLSSPDGGYLTAVLVEGELADLIHTTLKPGVELRDGDTTFVQVDFDGIQVYRLRQNKWGLDIMFTLEKSSGEILDDISDFYSQDPYNRALVLQEYRENRLIRIYRGDDVIDGDGEFSFREAMVGATIIGKTFQPFYGIHDGLGFIRNIGYLFEHSSTQSVSQVLTSGEEMMAENPDSLYHDFVYRLQSMEGSFPENLYILTRTLCSLREGADVYLSPVDFLEREWGGNREFALFFYKVLMEFDYDVRLIRINAGAELPNEYIVLYKEHDSRKWGMMGVEYWTGERFSNWTRISALYKGLSVRFQELDGIKILSVSDWIYPGSDKWQDSFY